MTQPAAPPPTDRLVHRPLTPIEAALVVEACSKSDVVWLRPVEDARAVAAWHVWDGDAVHVVDRGGEQDLSAVVRPGLGGVVEVIVPSKETRARLLTFLAQTETLPNGSKRWHEVADKLAAARLNAAGAVAADQVERWVSQSLIHSFRPVALTTAVFGEEDEDDGRLPPPGGPGTTLTRRPFHLGRRRRRARRMSNG
ncbi:hypothetical protein ACIB24_15515 [Spongisporangium articulatum]|uniref:Uncharacterized protein n=1 Tax=Spongisporangium articulatum TaxID=3362603 RepID=A0ABW8AQ50_9ACTN